MFYWDPESWQSKCLTQEKRIKQRMFQGAQRLLMEREIFHSWGDKYHIEFFYPSQKKVTWILSTWTTSFSVLDIIFGKMGKKMRESVPLTLWSSSQPLFLLSRKPCPLQKCNTRRHTMCHTTRDTMFVPLRWSRILCPAPDAKVYIPSYSMLNVKLAIQSFFKEV